MIALGQLPRQAGNADDPGIQNTGNQFLNDVNRREVAAAPSSKRTTQEQFEQHCLPEEDLRGTSTSRASMCTIGEKKGTLIFRSAICEDPH